jgi:hypothetical protein
MLRTTKTTKLGLGTAIVLLAMLDWMAGTTIAEPDGPAGAAPPDEMVPLAASLENATSNTLQLGPVAIRILPAGAGYVLEAFNAGDATRQVEVDVKVMETNVSPMARMLPLPREVSSVRVTLACAPHERSRRTLVLPGLAATTPAADTARANAAPPGLASFVSRTFVVADASTAGAAPTQVLRVSAGAPRT